MNKLALTAMVLGLGLIGCKKKAADTGTGSGSDNGSAGSATMTGSGSGSGSATMTGSGSGSAAMTGSGSGSAADAGKPKTGAELVELYKACDAQINAGKLDDFKASCLDPAYVGHEGGKDLKPDDVVAMFTGIRAAFPDMKLEPQLVLVNGKNIFGVGMESGTQSGAWKMTGMPDIPATNKKIGMLMFHRITINDANKASEEWAFVDPATTMFQLGLAPKEAGDKRPAMDKGMDGAPVVVVAADDDKEKKNLEVVKKGNDAFNAHKIADMMALMTDDTVESDQAAPKDAVGKKDVEAGAKMFMDAFSDGKMDKVDTWAAGDYVVTIGTFTGTNDHDMGKMKKTGKKVAVPVAEVSQLKDGKIAHVWRFYSSWDFAMQMGLMPMPGAAGAGGAGSGSGSGSAAPAAGSGSAAPAAGSGSAKK